MTSVINAAMSVHLRCSLRVFTHLLWITIFFALVLPTAAPPVQAQDEAPCLAIASDSNGYGHVSFLVPTTLRAGIVYIKPLHVVLRDLLAELEPTSDLSNLEVRDRSLSAGGITQSGRTQYMGSVPYDKLLDDLRIDGCEHVLITPFIPDIASNAANAPYYVDMMEQFTENLFEANPDVTLLIYSHYITERARFTSNNSGRGLTPERLSAFMDVLAEACAPDGRLGRDPRIVCIETQPILEGTDYLLQDTPRDEYLASLYPELYADFTIAIDEFFAANPDGALIGDGIHLNLEGRKRFMSDVIEQLDALID
jgi:hypothetical protein